LSRATDSVALVYYYTVVYVCELVRYQMCVAARQRHREVRKIERGELFT
jgi:hypothetical protein